MCVWYVCVCVSCYSSSLLQAERAHPGLSEAFIGGVLDAEGVSLNLPEVLLRLACHDVTAYMIDSEEDEFVLLNYRAKGSGQMYIIVDTLCGQCI